MITTVKEFRGHYAFLSNFAAVQVVGLLQPPDSDYAMTFRFHSVEAAYIAAKSTDIDWWDKCSKVPATRIDLGQLKAEGRQVPLSPAWDIIKDAVMYELLCQKFGDPYYRRELLNTVGMTLEEGNTWKDDYWGIDRNRRPERGLNKLGKMLMHIRDNLQAYGDCHGHVYPRLGEIQRGTYSS